MTEKLNAPGRFAAYFVRSKLTILLMIACLIAGIYAVLSTPREENPQITMPAANVVVTMPGATPSEMQDLVLRPVERLINQIPGVDHVYATAMDSAVVVSVMFKVGEDKEASLVKLYDRLLSGRKDLPAQATDPKIISADADDVPVLTVTLAGSDYDDFALRRIAQRFVEGLQSLEEVSSSYVWDGRMRQFEVTLDPKRLAAFGLLPENIRLALMSSNLSAPLGDTAQAKDGIALRYDGFLTSAEDLKNLVVANFKDRPVLLRDVAEVSDGASSERTVVSRWAPGQSSPDLALTQGRDLSSVTFAVAKKKGVNAVTAVDAMLERIERMQAQFLPEGVKLTVTRNDGDKANDAVNTVIEHIGVSVVAVFVITWLFLGLRSACIMGITIPLILAMTLFVNEFAGLTINRVTLFGFVIALGLLVDDSIVVIENIERHYSANPTGNRSYLAALSVAEIGYPTMLATFTVMIVFYTLIPTLTGMPKQYFFPIGFMVPAAVFSSLIIAYSVAPWLAVRFLKTKPKQTQSKTNAPELSRLGRFYHKTASYVIGRKWPTVGVFVLIALLMTGAILQPAWQFIRPQGVSGDLSFFGVEMGFLPKDNKNTFNVTIKLADGTPLEVTDRAVRDVAAVAKTIPEAVDILSWSGDSGVPDFTALFRGSIAKGSNIGAVRVNLTNKATGRRSSIDIARQLREDLKPVAARYPDSTIQVVEDPPGPPQRASVLAEIYGYDTDRLRPLAAQVREEFRQTWDMVETMTYESTDVRQARFEVDQEKAVLAGVLPAQVALALRRLAAGETVGYVHAPGERQAQPIVLRADYADKIDPENLAGLTVKNIQGKDVALSELVRVVEKHAEHNLMHKDGTPVIMVGGELGSSVPAYAVLDLDRRLNGMSAGNGLSLVTGNLGLKAVRADLSSAPVQLLWDGEIRMMLDAYHDLFIALAIAVITIFLVLVGYYRSFVLPVIVMSAIPVCFIGIMPGHWLTGQIFSATSLIGLVTLAGVLVRNSLLLSDFVVDYLKMGLPLKEAVLDAGAVRLRPILLTSLAIVFGSLIMLVDPVFGGLGCSFIFGTISSTILTMALTPILLYWYFARHPYTENKDDSNALEEQTV